jgi:antitoxin VapB
VNIISGLGFGRESPYLNRMETATVIVEGDRQTVRLPKSVRLPATVFVRQDGDAVVLEPARPKTWPEGFFESVHICDPAFERPEQGQLPPVKDL